MTARRPSALVLAMLAAALLPTAASGQGAKPAGSPEVSPTPLRSLFWGDTHVHSSYSLDAQIFNNTQLGPGAAFRFARGEAVDVGGGRMAQLARPLDFLLVSDHAEYMGLFRMIRADHELVAGSETARRVKALFDENAVLGPQSIGRLNELLHDDPLGSDRNLQRFVWDEVVEVADSMNAPGMFTALIGYEWGSTPDGNNLHRNVVFRDGAARAGQILPFSVIDSGRPEDLWRFMADYEAKTGGQAIAIPHNSNLSNGLMFAVEDSDGKAIDAEHARLRAHWEPIVEVTQIKGDSEAHPFLSPDDEFADYETWDRTNIFGLAKTERSMLAGGYARSALRRGLELEARVGVNPFKFGMIGSTDSHTSLATADEDNYWGKTSNMFPGSENRVRGPFIQSRVGPELSTMNWEQAASGYAGVWAGANTRAAIFDALRRKEVYATTGPRIAVRFFGGWRFVPVDARSADLASAGYAKGVPMGGDLSARPSEATAAPTFLYAATRDPEGATLERVQIVKGWVAEDGESREQVFDVRVAEPVVAGASELVGVWRDAAFDATRPAFYYLRVIESATPRWTAIERRKHGVRLEPGTRTEHQERAYTSPIWYSPPTDPS